MIFDRLWRIFCYANCLSKMFRKISRSTLNSSSLSKIVFKTQKEYFKQFWIIQFYFISFKRSKLVSWNDKIVEILHWNLPEICFKVDQKSADVFPSLTFDLLRSSSPRNWLFWQIFDYLTHIFLLTTKNPPFRLWNSSRPVLVLERAKVVSNYLHTTPLIKHQKCRTVNWPASTPLSSSPMMM